MKRFSLIIPSIAILCSSLFLGHAFGQSGTGVHYYHAGNTTPGVAGQTRLAQGGDVQGYYQPVLIRTPIDSKISIANENEFVPGQNSPMTAGLLIGSVYRICVTNIPFNPDKEVYPTIELIDRTYPPKGQELRFPIVVEITLEDLELALSGKLVTRVVYLEEPKTAKPIPGDKEQLTVNAAADADPFAIADSLGRPVAIVRIGSRTPDNVGEIDPAFYFNSPPWLGVFPDGKGGAEIVHFGKPGTIPLENTQIMTSTRPAKPQAIRR